MATVDKEEKGAWSPESGIGNKSISKRVYTYIIMLAMVTITWPVTWLFYHFSSQESVVVTRWWVIAIEICLQFIYRWPTHHGWTRALSFYLFSKERLQFSISSWLPFLLRLFPRQFPFTIINSCLQKLFTTQSACVFFWNSLTVGLFCVPPILNLRGIIATEL